MAKNVVRDIGRTTYRRSRKWRPGVKVETCCIDVNLGQGHALRAPSLTYNKQQTFIMEREIENTHNRFNFELHLEEAQVSVIWYGKTKCVCIFTYWFLGNYVLRNVTSNFQTLFVFTRSFGRYVDISTGDITHLPLYILAPCATNKYVGPIQLASHILVFD